MCKTYGWQIEYVLQLDHYAAWRLGEEIEADAWNEWVSVVQATEYAVGRVLSDFFTDKDKRVPHEPLLTWEAYLRAQDKPKTPEQLQHERSRAGFRKMFKLDEKKGQ